MSGFIAVGRWVLDVAWLAQIASFAVLLAVDLKREAHKRNPWKPRPSLRARWLYHHALYVYPVAGFLNLVSDGWSWWDSLLGPLLVLVWWSFKREDDYDDDDRDSVARGIRGRVERFGNRLRVVAPAPSS